MSVLNLLHVESLPKKMWKFHIFQCSEVLLTKSLILFQTEDSGLEFLWWVARLSKNVLTFLNFPLWKSTQLLQLKINAFEIQKLYYILGHKCLNEDSSPDWKLVTFCTCMSRLLWHFSKAVQPPFTVPLVNFFPNLLFNFSDEIWVRSTCTVLLTE